MREVKRVIKWWWACSQETVENWLEGMEARGWNLLQVDWLALRFHFMRGKPRQMRYCTDYQPKKDPEYRNVFQDAGWELVYSTDKGWYIWRIPYEGARPEAYNDIDSLIERNKRFIWFAAILSVIVPLQFLMSTIAVNESHRLPDLITFRYSGLVLLIVFGGYILARLIGYDNALKNKKQLKK